jgi:acetylornithine deacetylase/succinyl-diaminopimelate desuccinylase-like protein
MLKRLTLSLTIFALAASAQLDEPTKRLARDIFRELIEINTTDSVGNTTIAAQAMAKRLLDAGLPAVNVKVLGPNDRKGNLVVRFQGKPDSPKPILIIGHLDVVEARKEDWTTDPFQFVEKDGYFYGRGTQDMKVNDAALIVTLIRLAREGYRPNRDIIVALTADEEGGTSNGVDWLLKNHRKMIDAEYVLNADAGGVLTEKGKPIDVEIEASEKLYADFQLTASNPGGHSSLPVPDNAIYHIADALAKLERSPFPFELNPVTRSYIERLAPLDKQHTADRRAVIQTPPDQTAIARLSTDPHYNSTMRTTCVATRLSGGHANNALPQTAQAVVNCRILPGHSKEEVRQDLIRIFADPKVVVHYIDDTTNAVQDRAPDTKSLPPVLPRPELLKAVENIAAKMWPGAPVVPDMETGASDSIYTNAAGMPSYGVSGVALDHDDIRAHGKDERVRVSSYYDGVDFYYRLLKELTSTR